MRDLDLDRLENLAEALALVFYLLMFVALVMALAGSPGSGFLLLLLGSCAHVGRTSLSEFVDQERGPMPLPLARPTAASAADRAEIRMQGRATARARVAAATAPAFAHESVRRDRAGVRLRG
jgi:hypothetical protein